MERWRHNIDKEVDTVEQCSNELEPPGFPGVGLVIGSELVNPDPVSNSLWTATTDQQCLYIPTGLQPQINRLFIFQLDCKHGSTGSLYSNWTATTDQQSLYIPTGLQPQINRFFIFQLDCNHRSTGSLYPNWTATTDQQALYIPTELQPQIPCPIGECVSDIQPCCCQLLRFHRFGQW